MKYKSPEEIVETLLFIFKKLRTNKNLTYEELAEKAGIHRTMVSLLERGERNPTVLLACSMANALDGNISKYIQYAEDFSKKELEILLDQNALINEKRLVESDTLRNENKLKALTGLDSTVIKESIEYCYETLDIIDNQLLKAKSPPISNLVELANLSSMIGNLLGNGIAQASNGLYIRNRPHAFPDLLPLNEKGVNLEIKISLETNKPKGHLPKSGVYLTFRYVLGKRDETYERGKRGDTVWIWEAKVGNIKKDDFSISNTKGDSGKTAIIKTETHNNMALVYYAPNFLPYARKYPGYN